MGDDRADRFGDTGEGLQSLSPAALASIASDKARVAQGAIAEAVDKDTAVANAEAYIAARGAATAYKMASQADGDAWDDARKAWEATALAYRDLANAAG
jgi:hypothetical protein